MKKTQMEYVPLQSEEPESEKAESEEPESEQADLRIVLVGKTGVGKSASGNTILGRRAFESKISLSSVTSVCKKETGEFGGLKLAVVDTPGLFDTRKEQEQVKREIAKSICFAAPGPHVILIVLQFGRFTEQELGIVKLLQEMFGEQAACYTMVLFTCEDRLKEAGVNIKGLIKENSDLCKFIDRCRGGFHLFYRTGDTTQVGELVTKINAMKKKNRGRYYTDEMFKEAERAIREEMKRLQKKYPDMTLEEARKQAERDNSFIRAVLAAVGGGAAAGAAIGGGLGSLGGPVGAAAGAAVGTVVGAVVGAAAAAVKKKACNVQ